MVWNLSDLDRLQCDPCFPYLDDSDGPPSRGEILAALGKLKNHKTPGVDGISNEQLKYGSSGMVDYLETFFGKIWEEEEIPEDWSKGIIITLGKKEDTSHCSNNRGKTYFGLQIIKNRQRFLHFLEIFCLKKLVRVRENFSAIIMPDKALEFNRRPRNFWCLYFSNKIQISFDS